MDTAKSPVIHKQIEDFEDKFEDYIRRIFYQRQAFDKQKCDPTKIEYFGVLSLTDVQKPNRKLWYIYYCKQSKLDETIELIRGKYGKKNMYEIFRKPVYSGAALRAIVKKHFHELKWHASGNVLEAPPSSHYNDERVVKTITDLYNNELRRLYNYIMLRNNWFHRRY